ncbi:MAG: hypothetical protein AAFZ89_08355 [Bacteroidota bacterium]
MKKKFLRYSSVMMMICPLAFVSCEKDGDKDPQVLQNEANNIAPFVRIVVNPDFPVIDATALEGVVFSATVDDPADNVAEWEVQVRKLRGNDTVPLAPLTTISSFPSQLEITGQELADVLGIEASEIQPGDNVQFVATSTGLDGRRLTFAQLSSDLFGQPEQRQAYEFNSFVACPFNQDEIVGFYDVLNHRFDAFFGPQPPIREIIAGPGPNQYTIIGGAVPLDGADDLIIEVNPATGQVSFGGDPSDIHFNTFGPGVYGNITGFTFSCVGFIDLAITSPGFITNFFTLQKQ